MGVGPMRTGDSEKASEQKRRFEVVDAVDSSYLSCYPFECLGTFSLIFCQNEFPCPHTQIFGRLCLACISFCLELESVWCCSS